MKNKKAIIIVLVVTAVIIIGAIAFQIIKDKSVGSGNSGMNGSQTEEVVPSTEDAGTGEGMDASGD